MSSVVGFGSEIILWMRSEWGEWWTVGELAMGQSPDWSDAASAGLGGEGAMGEVVVDLLVNVDVPAADVQAQVHGGIDPSCRAGVKDHGDHRPAVGGNAHELDGEDVRVGQLGLCSDEPMSLPDVSHAFARHIVGGLEGHGDQGRH